MNVKGFICHFVRTLNIYEGSHFGKGPKKKCFVMKNEICIKHERLPLLFLKVKINKESL